METVLFTGQEKREFIMSLLDNCELPILDVLTRIYRKNGKYIQTTKKYKQRSKKWLRKK